MQTFLPHDDFRESARLLDYRRLGKQRVECLQILKAIHKGVGGWANHPATIMWRQYTGALAYYGQCCIEEWVSRGYRNTMDLRPFIPSKIEAPWWLGDPRLHTSHRSNLLRKDYKFYSKYGWDELPTLEYFWPAEYPYQVS